MSFLKGNAVHLRGIPRSEGTDEAGFHMGLREMGATDCPVVLIMGPPGSGKGTQCARLVDAFACGHLSIGEVLRDEIVFGTPVGLEVREFVEAGALVPDELVIEVALGAMGRQSHKSFLLLDGFPRTVVQAEALALLRPEAVHLCVILDVPETNLLDRLLLRARDDDCPNAIRQRLRAFEQETLPVLDWYERLGVAQRVDGTGSTADVYQDLSCLLEEAGFTSELV